MTADRFVNVIRASDDGRAVYVGQGTKARCHQKHRKNPNINALIRSGGTFPAEIVAGPMSQADAWAEEIRLIAIHSPYGDGLPPPPPDVKDQLLWRLANGTYQPDVPKRYRLEQRTIADMEVRFRDGPA
jgi:hypothetical protein